MANALVFGIAEIGMMHTDQDPAWSLETKFRKVSESGVYDYFDKTPEDPADEERYLALSEKYALPIRAGGWYYVLGRDEGLLKQKLELSARVGSVVHNTQILANHADGHVVSDDEVEAIYLQAFEWGDKCGCYPAFEVHINMWSEDFRRISRVADRVERRGIPFRITLDHSHVIFKIDNVREQEVFDIKSSIDSGDLQLDPFAEKSICKEWIERGLVVHAHARTTVPNNPRNTFAVDEHGNPGRGVQYPFVETQPGQYVEDWDGTRLEPWKKVVRQLFTYHARDSSSRLGQISTEFIPYPDYGGGHKYSIFDQSVACATWLKRTWQTISATQDAE